MDWKNSILNAIVPFRGLARGANSVMDSFGDLIDSIVGYYRKGIGKLSKGADNLFDSYTSSGMTDKEKETLDYSQQLKQEFFDKNESVPAQVQQYKDAGLNAMLIAGGGPSVSASSAPAPGSAGSGSPLDLLGMILNFAVQKQHVDNESALVEGRDLYNRSGAARNDATTERIRALIGPEKAKFEAETNRLIASLDNMAVERKLNESKISVNQAEAAVKIQDAAIKAIEAKHADEYWENYLTLQFLQGQLSKSQISRNYIEMREIEQEITNLQTANDNMIKEGIGIVLKNGAMAHEFEILGVQSAHESANQWIDHAERVSGIVTDIVGTAADVYSSVTGRGMMRAAVSRADTYRHDVLSRIGSRRRP